MRQFYTAALICMQNLPESIQNCLLMDLKAARLCEGQVESQSVNIKAVRSTISAGHPQESKRVYGLSTK